MALTDEAAARKDARNAKATPGDLQHRHFAVIPGILKDQGASRETCEDWADRLRGTNPRFDRRRFLVATGHD